MTLANLAPSPATSTMTWLTDLAYTLTQERPSMHFVCSPDGSFVSVFTCRERALDEWKYLCKKHKSKYLIFHGDLQDADKAYTVAKAA
jgi:hypothetical protein